MRLLGGAAHPTSQKGLQEGRVELGTTIWFQHAPYMCSFSRFSNNSKAEKKLRKNNWESQSSKRFLLKNWAELERPHEQQGALLHPRAPRTHRPWGCWVLPSELWCHGPTSLTEQRNSWGELFLHHSCSRLCGAHHHHHHHHTDTPRGASWAACQSAKPEYKPFRHPKKRGEVDEARFLILNCSSDPTIPTARFE